MKVADQHGPLVMLAVSTRIESIRYTDLQYKICGVNNQHIGDSGYGGLASVENIYEMSKVICGQCHTVSIMARSINR